MKNLKYYCWIAGLLISLFNNEKAFSQLKVRTEKDITKMVNKTLLGPGISVRNVIFRGDTAAIAIFDGTSSNIGLDSGILISTGKAVDAIGPNNISNSGSSNNKPGDGDLNSLLSTGSTVDAASLQFEFTPVAANAKFRFVFASEEYPGQVTLGFNDIFGFFLSGPNINGKENIAVIPGTSTPISIKTINHLTNTHLYVDNTNGTSIQYGGFTTVIEVSLTNLTPCEKYVIKMAIADVNDFGFDSGIFIEANSFKSDKDNEAQVAITHPRTGTILEKCDSILVRFQRSTQNTSNAIQVSFEASGTATMGLDYTNLPNFVTIPAGSMETQLLIFPTDDNITETPELLKIKITSNGICTISEDSILIKDYTPPEITGYQDVDCTGDTIFKMVKTSGGSSQLGYEWTDSLGTILSSSKVVLASPDSLTMFIITITDSCTMIVVKDTIYIKPIIEVNLNINPDMMKCAPDTVHFYMYSDVAGLQYQWTATDITGANVGIISDDTLVNPIYTVPSGIATIYVRLKVLTENVCANPAMFTINVIPKGLISKNPTYACFPDSATLIAFGGKKYRWTPNVGLSNDTVYNPKVGVSGDYVVEITDSIGCIKLFSTRVTIDTLPIAKASEDVTICSRASVMLEGSGSQYETYEWSPRNSLSNFKSKTPLANPNVTTTYILKAINNACVSFDTVVVFVVDSPKVNFDYALDSCAKTIALSNQTTGTDSVYWKFGDGTFSFEPNPIHKYERPGTYEVVLIANRHIACQDSMKITLDLNDVDPSQRRVPNVFTPNNDGKNDTFKITGGNIECIIEKISFYNRYGKLLFEMEDQEKWEWDGKINGEPAPVGIYFYSIIGKGLSDVGSVSLIY